MKRFIVLLAVFGLVLSGCSQKDNTTTQSSALRQPETVVDQIIDSAPYDTTAGDSEKENMLISVQLVGGEEWAYSVDLVVYEGSNAFEVFDLACAYLEFPYEAEGSGDFVYVTSVADLAAGDKGPYSGWMYEVNGEAPSVGMAQQELEDGDELKVYYVEDFE